MVEVVLQSIMHRIRRRSRLCMKQKRERLDIWLEKEERIKNNTQDCENRFIRDGSSGRRVIGQVF